MLTCCSGIAAFLRRLVLLEVRGEVRLYGSHYIFFLRASLQRNSAVYADVAELIKTQ